MGASTTSIAVTVTAVPNPNQPPVIAATAPADEAGGIGASTTLSVSIADPEGDATTVTFYGRKTTPLAPGPDFSVIAIPDTQFYSENTGRNPVAPGAGAVISLFSDQTQWIVNNRVTRNIAFVSHMGDIVQNGDFSGDPAEWIRADGAMKIIENQATTLRAYGIPWGVAPGNHDQSPIGDAGGTTTYYNQYFGSTRFAGRNYYGGHFGTNNNNNYQLFSASGLDFIIIHLEYDTRTLASYQAVLDWADALLKAYPNRRAIITSHWIINTGNPATFSTQGRNLRPTEGQPQSVPAALRPRARRRPPHGCLRGPPGPQRAAGLSGCQQRRQRVPAHLHLLAGHQPDHRRDVVAHAQPHRHRRRCPDTLGTFTLPYDMQSPSPAGSPSAPSTSRPAERRQPELDRLGSGLPLRVVCHRQRRHQHRHRRHAPLRHHRAAPPTVTLTGPANGASLRSRPRPILLTANAGDADGTVARVEFFDGAAKLGEDTAAPYEFIVDRRAARKPCPDRRGGGQFRPRHALPWSTSR